MAEDRNEQERGFTVVDRRHGREAMEERRGDEPPGGSEEAARREPPRAAVPPRPGADEPPGAAPGGGRPQGPPRREPEGTDRAGEGRAGQDRRGPDPERSIPQIDFATFLLSLSTSALHHLGLVAEREGAAPPPPNLPMARQTIDILEILQEKTQGNLDAEEANLLQGLLYELRMRFVEVQEQRGGSGG